MSDSGWTAPLTIEGAVQQAFRARSLRLVLVLSIAVLVLVLDSVLSHGLFSLDQSGQYRDDPFQAGYA